MRRELILTTAMPRYIKSHKTPFLGAFSTWATAGAFAISLLPLRYAVMKIDSGDLRNCIKPTNINEGEGRGI